MPFPVRLALSRFIGNLDLDGQLKIADLLATLQRYGPNAPETFGMSISGGASVILVFGSASGVQRLGADSANGSDTTPARSDHSHREPFTGVARWLVEGREWISESGGVTAVVGLAAATGIQTPGIAENDGASGNASRADHAHRQPLLGNLKWEVSGVELIRPIFGSPVSSGLGDAASDGILPQAARADHRHARESAGGSGFTSVLQLLKWGTD